MSFICFECFSAYIGHDARPACNKIGTNVDRCVVRALDITVTADAYLTNATIKMHVKASDLSILLTDSPKRTLPVKS